MRNSIVILAGVCLVSASAVAVTAARQQARPVSNSTPGIEEVLVAVRADLQGERADIVAKNVTLSSDQAAKFWPMFAKYQAEQNAIMDDQLKGIQRFIENFDALDDNGAMQLIQAHLDRDTKMAALRSKWLGDFRKAIGTKLAVRVMQIDRRLSLAHQVQFASKIPLAH